MREEGNPISKLDKGESSIDAQIDRLFVSYEKEAKNLKVEGTDFRSLVRRLLTEADDDEDTKDPSRKMTLDEINLDSFAESVVRLINNYDSLLEIRDTIIRRSNEFLSKNYESDVISKYSSILREEFDIEIGVSDVDKKYAITAPPADRAGPTPSS